MARENKNVVKSLVLGSFLIVFLLLIIYMNERLQQELDGVGNFSGRAAGSVGRGAEGTGRDRKMMPVSDLGAKKKVVSGEPVAKAKPKKPVRIYEQPINDPILLQ